MDNEAIEEYLSSLRKVCKLLGVKVTLQHRDDNYYIYFDGSVRSVEDWNMYYDGFDKYVKACMKASTLKYKDVITDPTKIYSTVYLGTLFDFLMPAKDQWK